jgi:hypothetical protein
MLGEKVSHDDERVPSPCPAKIAAAFSCSVLPAPALRRLHAQYAGSSLLCRCVVKLPWRVVVLLQVAAQQ